ncbi:protein LURP-one-related 15-like [Cryptomeria japonica]|uniref:protein LURP-one-related 15-like n=1 Tax=Cryptomeria japonica TaxID=3369 RepID=UPI0025ABC1A8|nr:protein LURP-one-related 15-like [Cryptomeria japonica]
MEYPFKQTKEFTVQRNLPTFSGGDFTVTDANGNVVFKSSGKVLSLHRRRLLQGAAGNPLLTMEKKILTMHKRWRVFDGDSINGQNFAFSVKRSSVFQLKTSLDVFMSDNKDEKLCDFHVKSSYFNRSCKIYQGDRVIAEVNSINCC